MNKKIRFGSFSFDLFNTILMLILSFAFLAPFTHIIFASISDPARLARYSGLLLWPRGFTLKGYEMVIKNPNITAGFLNSVIYVIAGTSLNLFMTSMMAYVLSRKNVMLNGVMMFLLVFTMFFSGGLIPFYLLVRALNMLNTRFALIIPGMVSVMNLIIMRTAFMQTPAELTESAKIDGANDFVIYFRILLPVNKAVIYVILLFYAVGHWNAWFNAMIFLNNRKLFPIQLILREILVQNDTRSMVNMANVGSYDKLSIFRPLVKYATTVFATLPILIVYPLIQKHFTKGVMIGSIKG